MLCKWLLNKINELEAESSMICDRPLWEGHRTAGLSQSLTRDFARACWWPLSVYQNRQGCFPRWWGKNWAASACRVQDTCIYLSRIDTCAVQIPGKESQEMPCIILHQDVAGVWNPQVIICPNLRVFICSAFFKKKKKSVPHNLGPNIHLQGLLVYSPSFGKSDAF